MKNYFKLMSLLLGMVLCSAAFVACGDDDDDAGQYAGNRLIGEWVWGEPNQNQEEMQHHQRGYIFNADGTCYAYMRRTMEGETWEESQAGTFVLNDLKLKITWTKWINKEEGETFEEPMEEPIIDECEIMYPETGNTGMFLKRYYISDGRQGWTEEGPFYKK